MREEAAEKERDDHFNNIRSVVPMKQEWMVKEKANTPAPKTSRMTWTCWTTTRPR
jgi:hypothetical protein